MPVAEYWTLGHQLFRTTPESYPATFVGGDIFDENIFKAGPVLDAGVVAESPRPELASLKSLTPLNGHVTVIHTSSFFHLFSEEQQLELAQKMAGLLSPVPGSTIFGMHAGLAEKGFSKEGNRRTGGPLFCHSPDSWKELWDGGIFKKGKSLTPTGTYSIQGGRGDSFFNYNLGEGANNWTSWSPDNVYLFHSVPTKGDGSYNLKETAKLGRTQGSHGCIRLSVPDSKWIMDNIPNGTKVVIKNH